MRPVSSRKFHAGTSLGEDGSASDTRLCFSAEEVDDVEETEEDTAGKGAVKEKVTVLGGLQDRSADSGIADVRQRQDLDENDNLLKCYNENREK